MLSNKFSMFGFATTQEWVNSMWLNIQDCQPSKVLGLLNFHNILTLKQSFYIHDIQC